MSFRNGRPDRANYRKFKIKSVEGQDDFASVAEVVRRRYSRLLRETTPAGTLKPEISGARAEGGEPIATELQRLADDVGAAVRGKPSRSPNTDARITSYNVCYTKLLRAQIRDPFLDRRYRELNADALEAGTKSGVLIDVENALDNIDTDGIENAFADFRLAINSFATNSTDRRELANILTQSAKKIVNIFNGYDAKLSYNFV